MKIAIIGAGLAGLCCAIECERLGVYPDVFERLSSPGWAWPYIGVWVNLFNIPFGDVRNYLKETHHIDIKPLVELQRMIMKSAGQKVEVTGKLGYLIDRGKSAVSLENQLSKELKKTAVHYFRPADYKELSQKYDYVVVATGKDTAAKELGVWEEFGAVHIRGAIALGSFSPGDVTFYFNTDYANHGYGMLAPYTSNQAVVSLFVTGCDELETDRLFENLLKKKIWNTWSLCINIPLPFIPQAG